MALRANRESRDAAAKPAGRGSVKTPAEAQSKTPAPGLGEAHGSRPGGGLDVAKIRKEFPILAREVNDRRLVYLDNAATTQKPNFVLRAIQEYYERKNANVHRGIHTLANEATEAYEAVRGKVGAFLGGLDPYGVVFTRNATEAINMVVRSWVEPRIRPGDEVLLTEMEHHANLVPWIQLAGRTGAVLRHLPIDDEGRLRLESLDEMLTPRTRILSLTHASNVLGTINPIADIARLAHDRGVKVLVDGAQSVPHLPVDGPALGADFLAFSAHKMLGPTGVGILWGRPELLEEAEPMLGGGEMIREVRLDRATWNEVPWKHEAGTPNIEGVVAFGGAIDYLGAIGMERVRQHEIDLLGYAMERVGSLPGVRIFGPPNPEERTGVVSFWDETVHPHDLATMLDLRGIAVRAGHHCAQPLMRRLGVPATARASFYIYNDRSDVDELFEALKEAQSYFGQTIRRA
ncbi:MAG: aminotransferase class V-fold PLP-dependent enzyme [Candidatus Eisenbacteria bacterium]